jgi:hypothetical protein
MNEIAQHGRRAGLIDRRSFLVGSVLGLGALGLAGCGTIDGMSLAEAKKLYGPLPDEKFPIPAVDVSKVNPKYYRRTVRYDTKEEPGTIIVDPGNYSFIASRARDPLPAMVPMSAAPASCGAVTLMSGAKANGRPGHRPRR